MKPPKHILTSGAAALLLALCASAHAGTFNLYTLTGDADSGISANDAFTHAIDINGNGNTTVNGAVFTASFGGNPGNQGNIPGTNNYSTTGLPNTFGGYTPPNVGGTIGSLMQNFNYGGNPETVTLNNLRVGQQYTTNFYSDSFGSPGGRLVGVTTSDGGSINFDQNIGGTRLQYTFVAAATSMTYTITPTVPGDTFHNYAFTNKMNGYKSLFTDNFRGGGNPDTNDVNFNISGRQGGSLVLAGGPISYSKDGNTQVGNDTGYGGQQPRQKRRIGDLAQMGIDNAVAAIGDKNVAVLALSQHHVPGIAGLGKYRGHRPLRRGQAERNNLNRQRKAAENIDPFGVVGDHDHAIRSGGHDLFAQQRAAAALDQVERGIDLVGAVDGEVEPIDIVERGQGDAALLGLDAGRLRGRHAHHVQSGADLFTEQVDKMPGGRTGAEAELHAVPHMLKRARRRLPFQFVHIHAQCPREPPPLSGGHL